MKALVIEGGSLVSRTDLEVPEPGSTELLVRIHAASVNYVDLMRKPSHFGATGSRVAIAGLEFAGVVEAVGGDVSRFKTGDRVMAMEGGAYAEYACVDERVAAAVPEPLGWFEASAVMVSFMTAHDALCTHGQMIAGDSVLIGGCTSGVGIAAAQLARSLGARKVTGTSTSREKLAQMTQFGLTQGICVSDGPLQAALQGTAGEHGVDVIVDMVGAKVAAEHLAAAAIGARWVSVGRLSGSKAEIDLNELARKRVALIGVTFRTRSLLERAAVVERFTNDVLPGLNRGALKPKVDQVFDLSDAEKAQEYVRSGSHFGKVVLQVRR